MTGLATADYWDDYYRQSPHATFDWYLPNQLTLHRITTQLHSLASTFNLAPHSLHLLQVGCGSSALTSELVASGYTHLTNIDFSPTIIQTLQHQPTPTTHNPPAVTYHCMDARALTYPAHTFHFVLDKGTLDCCVLAAGGGSGGRMLDEVWRVLKWGGVFMCFSVHGYEARMAMMEETEEGGDEEAEGGKEEVEERKEKHDGGQQEGTSKVGSGRRRTRRAWDVEYHTLAGPLEMPEQQHSYLYICTKWQQHDK